ncbi:CocE/NonD family hydrolase [Nocardia transvalensis]|uniref:CocE/NonD family hydrolase n=1 Tax=Nocardia transvalensis TaxID=37333 RepID=UPI001894F00C|nr:CocE/NonD family hydrolase [Nocardia transvalensis]MBF6334115.1 CocE/NonD family hydrolase [Nocardia transvalensis]
MTTNTTGIGLLTRCVPLLAAALISVTVIAPVASALPADGGGLGAQWTATHEAPPEYPAVHIDWDVPITMSDGTVLKANIYRPMDAAGHVVTEPTPTILNMTPYTKLITMIIDSLQSIPGLSEPLMNGIGSLNADGTALEGITDITQALSGGGARAFGVDRELIRSGYTQVVVDVRGTGFSQGIWQVFGAREQQDNAEVIDWISRQPWNDGKVGMNGVSYSAINQFHAAEANPPALKAIFPIEAGTDLMRGYAAQGGGLGPVVWGLPLIVNVAKFIPDLQSILQGRFDMKWLTDRLASPMAFEDYAIALLTTPSMDQLPPRVRQTFESASPFRQDWTNDLSSIRVPTFVVGGWHDVWNMSAPRQYNGLRLPTAQKKLLMGDTYHLNPGSGFGRPGTPPRLDVLQRAWFDKWLKGIDNGIDEYGPVVSQRQGGGWSIAPAFPHPDTTHERVYLSAAPSGTTSSSIHDGTLTFTPPADNTRLTVAPGIMSICSRDTAETSMGITSIVVGCTTDARPQELNGLTFTSAPVTEPTLVSGPINLHLNTVLDATDGYWTATVNDVAPDGRSTMLTTGQLVASLRAIDDSRTERSADGDIVAPYYTLDLATRQPVVPGQPTTVDIGFNPTEAVLQPGHRLRVDIYASNFPKGVPALPMLIDSGLKPQHIQLDPTAPSYVTIPLSRTW